MECFVIRSADGKEFMVGSYCVEKTGDKGLKRVVASHVAAARKARAAAVRDAKVERVRAMLNDPAIQARLAALPHPMLNFTDRTMLDYIAWRWDNSGNSGRADLEKMLNRILETGSMTAPVAAGAAV
jgi:hypothetical protein